LLADKFGQRFDTAWSDVDSDEIATFMIISWQKLWDFN
jgi:hypothetical protein